jgi:hypothetical protein
MLYVPTPLEFIGQIKRRCFLRRPKRHVILQIRKVEKKRAKMAAPFSFIAKVSISNIGRNT